jgi:serine/threonine protein kinase
MASYRYQRGDRPLEGYTIEHAVGRGGFGEVYYAVSDSGKQVALKAVQNYEDIELRGSGHCMNLKSPHLVTIFDVRHSERGDPFVIMEYVSGPSLRELLDDSPEGLGPEKAAWFIREISKAVSLLHDNGIVHRDLKPHNVFFEDGYVMVGDYSLSKVITTSHRSGHTLTVGTVHYMAPEISLGRYDRTVDIYALGVLLYEMLTGKPPFLGESMGEVLMKHMSQEADVSALPEPYASVVQKAMARDPEQRYQSPDEMVEALFGTDSVRDGASGFDPGSLTMIARRAVEKSRPMPATLARDSDALNDSPRQNIHPVRERLSGQRKPNSAIPSGSAAPINAPNSFPFWIGQLISRTSAWLAIRPYPKKAILWERSDELRIGVRSVLVAAALVVGTIGIAYLGQATGQPFISPGLEPLYIVPLLALSMTAGAAMAGWLLAFFRIQLPWFVIRGIYFAGCTSSLFAFSQLNDDVSNLGADFLLALVMPLLVMDWRWITSSRRRGRVSVVPSLVAAAITLIASLSLFDSESYVIAAVGLAATAAMATQLLMPFSESRSHRMLAATDWLASLEGLAECRAQDDAVSRVTPRGFGGTTPGLGLNAAMEVQYDMEVGTDAAEPLVTDEDYDVWWQSAKADAEVRSAGTSNNESGELPVDAPATDELPKARMPALVLSLLPFLMMPLCGLHRFYAGKQISGMIYFLTLGLFGIGQLVDVVLIALGEFRDSEGRLLKTWRSSSSPDELSSAGEQVNSLSVVPAPRNVFSNWLAVVGAVVLTLDIVLGFLLAINGPKLIAAGALSPLGLSPKLKTNIMGMPDWEDLIYELWALVCGILSFVTVGLLMAARIRHGVAHVARVVPAAILVGTVFAILKDATNRIKWDGVITALQNQQIGRALQLMTSHDLPGFAIGAAAVFSVGLFILAWPPKPQTMPIVEQVRTPVAQGR